MTKKRWTVEDKAKIVMESLTTSTSTVDNMQKVRSLAQHVLPLAREVLGRGQGDPGRSPSARTVRAVQKENDTLKTLVGEITLAKKLSATGDAVAGRTVMKSSPNTPFVVLDGTTRTDTITVLESGSIITASLTLATEKIGLFDNLSIYN